MLPLIMVLCAGDGGWWKESKYTGFEDESSIDGDDEDELRKWRRYNCFYVHVHLFMDFSTTDGSDEEEQGVYSVYFRMKKCMHVHAGVVFPVRNDRASLCDCWY
jgi:hypothetical protein